MAATSAKKPACKAISTLTLSTFNPPLGAAFFLFQGYDARRDAMHGVSTSAATTLLQIHTALHGIAIGLGRS